MKLIIYWFVVVNLILYGTVQTKAYKGKVFLLSHQWCRKCDKVIKIMQKLKTNLQNEDKSASQSQQSVEIQLIHLYDDFHQQRKVQAQNVQQNSEKIHSSSINDKKILNLEHIYSKIQDIYGLDRSEIPFPTIWIECPYYTGFYQNQLTYSQIYYWIDIYCKGEIPLCQQQKIGNQNNNQQDYHFQISSSDFQQNQNQVINFQMKYPFAKLCHSGKKIEQKYSINSLKDKIQQGPLFFSHFNHNLKNYLYNSQNKVGIFLLFNNPAHSRVKEFIDIYKFISDSLHNDQNKHINEGKISNIFSFNQSHKIASQYHKSSINNYDFISKKQIYQNLVFISACYNQNKRDCMMKYDYSIETNIKERQKDSPQMPIIQNYKIPFSFISSKAQILKKILQFSHIKNIFQSQKQGKQNFKHSLVQIVAFYFDKQTHQISSNIFDHATVKLGNDFLFWLQKSYSQIVQKKQKNQIKQGQNLDKFTTCLSSEVIHYISGKNLSALKNNVKLKKLIQKMNKNKQKQIKFKTIIMENEPQRMSLSKEIITKRWKPQYYQICIKNKPLKIFYSIQEAIKQLNFIQNQKEQIQISLTNQL